MVVIGSKLVELWLMGPPCVRFDPCATSSKIILGWSYSVLLCFTDSDTNQSFEISHHPRSEHTHTHFDIPKQCLRKNRERSVLVNTLPTCVERIIEIPFHVAMMMLPTIPYQPPPTMASRVSLVNGVPRSIHWLSPN